MRAAESVWVPSWNGVGHLWEVAALQLQVWLFWMAGDKAEQKGKRGRTEQTLSLTLTTSSLHAVYLQNTQVLFNRDLPSAQALDSEKLKGICPTEDWRLLPCDSQVALNEWHSAYSARQWTRSPGAESAGLFILHQELQLESNIIPESHIVSRIWHTRFSTQTFCLLTKYM